MERRFDVEQSATLPAFEGTAALDRITTLPAQTLDVVYFDSPTRDLAAKQLSLCREGNDWRLRLPAGADGSIVVQGAPHTTLDEVPAELRDVVLAVVRDRPLAPVAQARINRRIQLLHDRSGAVVAEFYDEQLTGSTFAGAPGSGEQRWRQWTLLADGPAGADLLDELSDRLRGAGAVPAGPLPALLIGAVPAGVTVYADQLHQAVAEQIDELLMWDRAVRADADDAVHQMRVTLRRIRSLLQTSADTFGLGDDGWILDELRWLAGLLGTARDAEVLAQRYRHALDRLPSELVRGRVRERLVDEAAQHYRAGLRRSLAAMRSPRYFRLLGGLDAVVSRPTADSPARPDIPAVSAVDRAYRRVRMAAKKAARIAGDPGYDDALHRIRKSAKRLRYTAAATQSRPVAERAKTIQTLLGDHQDSVVSRAHLLEEAAAALDAGEDTFTYGLLYQQEDDVARSCRGRLDHALDQLGDAVGRADELACKPD